MDITERQTMRQLRRPLGCLTSLNISIVHPKKPWVVAWWSAAFPGFGHIMLCNYVKGFLLVGWEFFVNIQANLNLSIYYSFTGKFNLARNTLKIEWAILYVIVYVFAIWDTYRTTVELNKYYKLAHREGSSIIPVKISNLEINYLDKRNPWIAFAWSLLLPGLGHFYCIRMLTTIFLGLWWSISAFYSGAIESIYSLLTGDFTKTIEMINIQWLLFMPSIYGFAAYDAYNTAIEYNKLFEFEQTLFLKGNYQNVSLNIFGKK